MYENRGGFPQKKMQRTPLGKQTETKLYRGMQTTKQEETGVTRSFSERHHQRWVKTAGRLAKGGRAGVGTGKFATANGVGRCRRETGVPLPSGIAGRSSASCGLPLLQLGHTASQLVSPQCRALSLVALLQHSI